jgi:putative ABC transport system permease protein
MNLWLRYAWRDLRSGLQGFWIFLSCLALGTAAIAIVGSLAASIERGLIEQGQPLLGGDIEFSLIHREVNEKERAYVTGKGEVSTVATMRAMAVAGEGTALVEVKAADAAYPLYGALTLTNGGDFQAALAEKDGKFGVVVDELLLGRLSVPEGSLVKIGNTEFVLRGLIAKEPDRLADGIVLGPRVIMSLDGLKATGLIQPGSLITWRYRVKLPANTSLADVKTIVTEARETYADSGWRVRARDNAAAGADRFVERLSYFMTLVGLTALIVGGAGIANAVSAFVNRKTDSIATLKCLGAPSSSVFGIYLTQIIVVAIIAIALGLAAGAIAPAIAHALLADILPLPLASQVEWAPLGLAAAFGFLVTIAFSIWPLARTRLVPASALFRHRIAPPGGWPRASDLIATALALLLIAALTFLSFEDWRVTAFYLGGLVASFIALFALAQAIVWAASKLPKPKSAILRYAIANLHRPGSSAASVILALGLGLTLFVMLALTDGTISRELRSGIPEKAPAFYFLDVRNQDRQAFVDLVKAQPGVTDIGTAPMLRGRMVSVKGVPADKAPVTPDASWALRGDRGLTYADALPSGSKLVAGEWWPQDYSGPPLVSFVDEIAEGLALKIGDEVKVNVLGRDITAKVANTRAVEWRSIGINFVMVFSPNTLEAAPHSHIVTVEMEGGDEAKLLNTMSRAFPTSTAVRVKDAINAVSDLLAQMLAAIRGANILTLLTGVLVLAGALAAGLSGRVYDAVVLKTYGASRRQLMQAFIAEYAILGLAAAVFGLLVGALGAWFLAFWILEMPFTFSLPAALFTALGAMAVTITAGLAVTWRALTVKPAPLLRNE